MSDTTPDETLQAVRARRGELEEAMAALEKAAAAPSAEPVEWAAGVAARVGAVELGWVEHLAVTEGPNGLHADIVEIAPRLKHAVDRLQADHADIATLLRRVSEEATTVSDGAAAEALHGDVVELLVRLTRHRHVGANIVYDAFNVDLSTAD
jgi:prefoldin subunit 5